MKTTLELFIPVSGTTTEKLIDRGSAIVAKPNSNIFYYEGNRHKAENLVTYEQRIVCAAGRLTARYPTIAFGQFNPADLTKIGTYDAFTGWVLSVLDFQKLHEWVDRKDTLSLTDTNHAVFNDFHLIHGFNKLIEKITGLQGYAFEYPHRNPPLTTEQLTEITTYFNSAEEPIAAERLALFLELLQRQYKKKSNV